MSDKINIRQKLFCYAFENQGGIYEMKETKKIAVFFGGHSTEYKVSLQSAYAIIKSIDQKRYTPILIGIDAHTGDWSLYQGEIDKIESDCWKLKDFCISVFPSLDRTIHGFCYVERNTLKTISLDAALPVLHGKNGEDGTIQGMLELMGVPVIGCGLLSSALCMDKALAHRIAEMNGIKTARFVTLKKGYSKNDALEQAAKLGYPVFVKPVRSGSSFGITKVSQESNLIPAIEHAFSHDSTVILEEMIKGFEVGCAVIGTKELIIGEVDEIELSEGFFDYTEKYTLKTSNIHVPARISPEKSDEIKQTALRIYRMLYCSCFARVDMFLTPEGEIYFNEVNTIPGFTTHSRFPNMLKAAGLTFDDIVERLLNMEE